MVPCHKSIGPVGIAWMEWTWPSTPLAFGAWLAGAALKMAMCETEERRMTHPMSVCRGSVLPQNAHEDCTTPHVHVHVHVRRMTARRLPDHDPALGGRDTHEKRPSWLVGGLMDD